jgi:hypothetical protein
MFLLQTRRRRRWVVLATACALAGVSVSLAAQFARGGYRARLAAPEDFDGQFHLCRLVYQQARTGWGGSWRTDFPRADVNVSIRLAELTRTRVSVDSTGQPNHLLVRPVDYTLFQCPFVLMSAPGSAFFSDLDAERLRLYLEKGGFLWVDDFWGSSQWAQWESQFRKVLPADRYAIEDMALDHPLLRAQFVVDAIPQIPNIGFFFGSGGRTSEQGADSAVPHARIVSDARGRVMVLMTHNTDIADSWEREGDDPTYFATFGPRGYGLGINVLLHALTH